MSTNDQHEYQVLARKYRPVKLSELIGQDMLVQTISNAINSDRIPHAFILTGIRGVGKTSAARILARSLICTGEKGEIDNPTTEPCGVCDSCIAIAEDRHVDVLEMDAASRTGVSDIREIIENVSYHPVIARYKIYIIDEVHMLSKSAFNALLKTLEEPPPHAKFIFATTEIRKIPVTILSRCMRFDLPRIDEELLKQHLQNIADKEEAVINEEALLLISHAAEGSVRDALSLLDQAIGSNVGSEISHEQVQEMLGVADRDKVFDLFSEIVEGKTAEAIGKLRQLYHAGADPITIMQDLLELSHFITQIKVMPNLAEALHIAENDRKRGKELADKLPIPFLTRAWQMLLKGIAETKIAPNTLVAAEMIIVRLCYVSNSPTPGDLIKKIESDKEGKSQAPAVQKSPTKTPETVATINSVNPKSFKELVNLFNVKDEYFLHSWLQDVSLVNFDAENRSLEFKPHENTPPDLAGKMTDLLNQWTGERWIIAVSRDKGGRSLRQENEALLDKKKEQVLQDEDVNALIKGFPGATISRVEEIYDAEENTNLYDENLKKSGEGKV